MLPILLLSGERKAMLFFLICGLLYLVHAKPFLRPTGWLAIFGALAIAIALAPSLLEIPYVEKQVGSILAPISTAELWIYSPSEYFAESLSNAQRVFATKIGMELFIQRPITGVGTNAYQEIVWTRFHLPPVMVNSIHSEFLRVLVENGVVGLLLFSSASASRVVHLGFQGSEHAADRWGRLPSVCHGSPDPNKHGEQRNQAPGAVCSSGYSARLGEAYFSGSKAPVRTLLAAENRVGAVMAI